MKSRRHAGITVRPTSWSCRDIDAPAAPKGASGAGARAGLRRVPARYPGPARAEPPRLGRPAGAGSRNFRRGRGARSRCARFDGRRARLLDATRVCLRLLLDVPDRSRDVVSGFALPRPGGARAATPNMFSSTMTTWPISPTTSTSPPAPLSAARSEPPSTRYATPAGYSRASAC